MSRVSELNFFWAIDDGPGHFLGEAHNLEVHGDKSGSMLRNPDISYEKSQAINGSAVVYWTMDLSMLVMIAARFNGFQHTDAAHVPAG